ncbi:MAG: hypothetical protein U0325_17270 [Polyangiales bacterium]
MAQTKKKKPARAPRAAASTKPPLAVDLSRFIGLVPFELAKPTQPKLAGDCLRECLPPKCYSLVAQFGALFTRATVSGGREIDPAWGPRYAALVAERFGYPVADVQTVMQEALDAWNAANIDAAGTPVPFP